MRFGTLQESIRMLDGTDTTYKTDYFLNAPHTKYGNDRRT